MKVVVSGATGFVGNTIARHLLEAGHQVRALSRSTGRAMTVFTKSDAGRRGLAEGSLTFIEADVTKPRTLAEAVAGMDVIVQAAQFPGAPVEDPRRGLTYMSIDRDGTINLLEAVAAAHGVGRGGAAPADTAGTPGGAVSGGTASADPAPASLPRFLYISGITVSPTSPHTWDKAKWQAEEAIRASGLPWTIVRISPMYGRDDVSFNRLIAYSDHLPFVPIFGDGRPLLTPLFVEDTGRFFALLVDSPERCRQTTFGLGGPETVSIDRFLQMILRAKGRSRAILHIPKPVGKVQGAVMQFLPGRPLTPAAVDFVSAAATATDEQRTLIAQCFPEFEPTPIREGLESYLRPFRGR